jgi:hypothetical protein
MEYYVLSIKKNFDEEHKLCMKELQLACKNSYVTIQKHMGIPGLCYWTKERDTSAMPNLVDVECVIENFDEIFDKFDKIHE